MSFNHVSNLKMRVSPLFLFLFVTFQTACREKEASIQNQNQNEAQVGKPETNDSGDDGQYIGLASVQSSLSQNFANATGYASSATGGAGGATYVVQNLSNSGSGSLREALESPSPLMIKFKPGLNGVISLSSSIMVKSNKTVDGRGNNITISPADPTNPATGFVIADQSNVIIFSLNFDGLTKDWDKDSEGADGINLKNAQKIWIHRCTFSRWVDGAIDARPNAGGAYSSDVTISANRFERIYQALNITADRVTFSGNLCSQVRSRCIKIINGKAHSFNNLIEDWGLDAIQNAKDGAQLFSEENIFIAGKEKAINKEENGKIQVAGLGLMRGAKVTVNSSVSKELIAEASKIPSVIRCKGNSACLKKLAAQIRSNSGQVR